MVDQTLQITELFEAKAHLGHKKNRIHPKSRRYIYRMENGVSIIDLTITARLLEKALEFISELAKNQKKLLFVATKKIAASEMQTLCQKHQIPYITTKWPAGLLSNFETITKNITKLKTMKKDKEEGAWLKFVKHDRVKLEKEMMKLEKHYGGLIQIEKMPDALFIVDVKKEKNAVKEARNKHIPIAAITDTNADPTEVDYPIPANDDSLSSIEYIVKKVVEAYTKTDSKLKSENSKREPKS